MDNNTIIQLFETLIKLNQGDDPVLRTLLDTLVAVQESKDPKTIVSYHADIIRASHEICLSRIENILRIRTQEDINRLHTDSIVAQGGT